MSGQLCFLVCLFQLCSMDLSPSGGLGIVSSVDGKVWVWDTGTGEKRVSGVHGREEGEWSAREGQV